MKQYGRKSAASLSVLPMGEQPRPEPPDSLTEEEAQIWRDVVGGLPPEWFGAETWLLLEQYCRHGSRARAIARAVSALGEKIGTDDFDALAYDKLLIREQAMSGTLAALATKMRISQQSTYDRPTKKAKPQTAAIWSDRETNTG